MPPRPRRPTLPAGLGRHAWLVVAIALIAVSGAPTGTDAIAPTVAIAPTEVPFPIATEPATGVVGPWRAMAADTPARSTPDRTRDDDSDPNTTTVGRSRSVTRARGPSAVLEPLTVEQGELIFHWRDTESLGSSIAQRSVRIEQAAATPTGCGDFEVVRGIALGGGAYDDARLSLGRPPSDGCLRVSLVLIDGVGWTSITRGPAYRVQPPAVAKAKPATPRWSGRYNLFRANTFVTQKTYKWCVAASLQMMVNIVRHRTDRSRATQARMIAYAQRWDDGPYGEEGGTDVTGWINALRHYGAGRYRAVGTTSLARALRLAATAMAQTGRPAGILVMDGRHAWVLHGFESTTDPRRDQRAAITAVRVSGPLYPLQQKSGYDPRPNTRMTATALTRYFKPTIVGSMVGKYVVVIPTH